MTHWLYTERTFLLVFFGNLLIQFGGMYMVVVDHAYVLGFTFIAKSFLGFIFSIFLYLCVKDEQRRMLQAR